MTLEANLAVFEEKKKKSELLVTRDTPTKLKNFQIDILAKKMPKMIENQQISWKSTDFVKNPSFLQ